MGPLLFLVYVNDVTNAVPNIALRLFADDTSVFLHDHKCSNLIEMVKSAIGKLNKWFDTNKLTLHLGKTNYTIFHPTKMKNHNCQEYFELSGAKISKMSSIKYLGIVIDDCLLWKEHVNDVYNKLIKYTGIFYRIRHHLTPEIAMGLFNAFILSRISYGIEIYGMASGTILKPLQVLQNRLLKILNMKPKRYSTDLLHYEMGLLKINDIHKVRLSGLLHKYINSLLPTIFNNIFRPGSAAITRTTRTNEFFITNRCYNKHGHLLLNNYCLHMWQCLPVEFNGSLGSFINKLKVFYISHYM